MSTEPQSELNSVDESTVRFGVMAEVEGYANVLCLVDVPFARLMDDIVVPYESGEKFFIDGVPVKQNTLKRIKLVFQNKSFNYMYYDLTRHMRVGQDDRRKTYADQYHTRLEASFRCGDDVTAQILKAYDKEIRPRLSDYLPKREQILTAAWQFFFAGMTALSNKWKSGE